MKNLTPKILNLITKFVPNTLHLKTKALRRNRKYIALALLAFAGFIVLRTPNAAEAVQWWPQGGSWQHRKQLTITNNSGDDLAATTTIAITLDTKTLYDAGKLQADCDDLRILYQPDNNTFAEVTRHLVYPDSTTCATSTATKVYFSQQAAVSNGSSDTDYYLYYGNVSATTPSDTENAFDIDDANATFICPFNGSTTCAAGETPTTENGAVRYSGNKGALQCDGKNVGSISSWYSGTPSQMTIETWVYLENYASYSGNGYEVLEATGTSTYSFYIATNGKPLGYIGGKSTGYATNAIPLSTWTHLAVVYDGSTLVLYVNGVASATNASPGAISGASGTMYSCGRSASNQTWPGMIDELRISTTARYTSNFTPSVAPFPRDAHTWLLFHFDENGDDPRNSGKAIDDSGNGKHMTLSSYLRLVTGLVGINKSSSQSSNYYGQSYAAHNGVFLEEATTNKVTNPSFEHATYDTNWTAGTKITGAANTTVPLYYFGSQSTKLTGSGDAEYLTANADTDQPIYTSTSTKRLAQGFQIGSDASISGILVSLKRNSFPTGYFKFEIQTDSSGVPSGTPVTNGSITCTSVNDITNGYSNVTYSFPFSTYPSLTGSTQYHLVMIRYTDSGCTTEKSSPDSTSYMLWRYDNSSATYANGDRATMNESAVWTTGSGTDFIFGIYGSEVAKNGYTTSIDAGNTNNHTLSAYVYQISPRLSSGSYTVYTPTTSTVKLIFNGTAVTPTYTSMEDGWFRLSYTGAAGSGSQDYGIQLLNGNIIYVDGFQLEEKAYTTTYTDGSLTSAAGGTDTYFWDDDCDGTKDAGEDETADQNAQCSTRTVANLQYATDSNVSAAAGSFSFWAKPQEAIGSVVGDQYLFDIRDDDSNRLAAFMDASEDDLTLNTNGTTTSSAGVTMAAASWNHFVLTWDFSADQYKLYKNGVTTPIISTTTSLTTPSLPANFVLGGDYANSNKFNGTLSDFRSYSSVLTATEVTDLYYAGLSSHQQSTEIDVFGSGATAGEPASAIWHFDEGTGTTTYDSSRLANNLTLGPSTSTPTWSAQGSGRRAVSSLGTASLDFDGSDDYVYRSYDTDFNFGTDPFSISGWFNHPSTQADTDTILARYSGSTGYKVYMNSSGYLCFLVNTDSACTTTSFADDTWHHFEVTRGASTITVYIDGVQKAQTTGLTPTTVNASVSLYLGIDSDASSNPWDGYLDEIYIYPYERSAAQVKTDYNTKSAAVMGIKTEDTLNEGLMGYWKMDEAASPSLDSTSYGNNGTWGGDAAAAVGKYSNGVTFDGTGDYIDVGSSANLDNLPRGGAFSVSTWFKYDNEGVLLSKEASASTYGWYIRKASTTFQFLIGTNGTNAYYYVTANAPSTGSWYHVVATYDDLGDRKPRIYINGTYLTPQTHTAATGTVDDDSSYNLSFGKLTSGFWYLDGIMDEVRIYNRILNEEEIGILSNWGPVPIAHWKLDEGAGSSAYNSVSSYYTGTLGAGSSAPSWSEGKYGNALKFDGSTDYVDVGTGPTAVNTVSFWINPTTTTEYPIDLNGTAYVWVNSGTVTAEGVTSPTIYVNGVPSTTVTAGAWQHISVTTATALSASDLDIGRIEGVGFMEGLLDHIHLYNYERTQKQVVEDMLGGHPSVTAGGGYASASASRPAAPIAYYKFDEGADNTCSGGTNDVCNQGSGGTALDGTSTATRTNNGKYGKALDFDGSDDIITIANADPIDLNVGLAKGFTFSAWIYAHSDGEFDAGKIFWKGDNTYLRVNSQSGNNLGISASVDLATTNATASLSSVTTINNWNHIAMVWQENDELTIYVNGVNKGSSTNGVGAPDADSNNLTIGGTYNFDGLIDEVKLYNYALTPGEIKIDFNQGSAIVMGYKMGAEDSGFTTDRWWEAGGATGAVAVYQPLGAANLEASYINLANPGTNDAVGVGTSAPSWAVGTGWTFDGSNDYLSTGIVPTTSYSVLMRVSGITYINETLFSSDDLHFAIRPRAGGATVTYYNGGNSQGITMSDTSGVFGLVGFSAYFNGVLKNSITPASYTNVSEIFIMANSSLSLFQQGSIQAMAIYDNTLSTSEVAAVTDAMSNLGLPPIAEWKLDENTGSTVQDTSGQGNTGTIASATWKRAGDCKYGSCLSFDGTDDYVKFSIISYSAAQPWSASFWVYSTLDNNVMPIGKSFLDRSYIATYFAQDRLYVRNTSAEMNYVEAVLDTNKWHHIYVTAAGDGNFKGYVDGLYKGSASPGAAGTAIDFSQFGHAYQTWTPWALQGKLDNLKIYNYVRTPAQIAYEYDGGQPQVHFKLDECSGTTAYDSSTTGKYDGIISIGASGDNSSAGTCGSGTGTEAWNNGTSGKYNYSLDFDGTDDYIEVGTGPTTAYATAFWVKPATTTEYFVNFTGATDYVWANSGTVTATGFTSPTIYVNGVVSSTLTASTWNHIVVTSNTAENASALRVGRVASTNYLDGQMDDVRIYSYPLTSAEVRRLYNEASSVRFGPNTGSP